MEFASYLAGEQWSDHPSCTHPLLAALARDVNDLTSNAHRNELMPLVTRVLGLTSDDPLFAASIAVRAACAALPVVSMERQRALAAGLISLLDRSSSPELSTVAHDALRQVPDAESWARRYLSTVTVRSRHPEHAMEAMVHASTIGIAAACFSPDEPGADARLASLLSEVIAASEVMLTPSTGVRTPALV